MYRNDFKRLLRGYESSDKKHFFLKTLLYFRWTFPENLKVVDAISRKIWPLKNQKPNLQIHVLEIYIKIMKMNFHIFLDIASTTFKFSGNVHFINWKSHAKYYGCVSTGRDATPRVPIVMNTPVHRAGGSSKQLVRQAIHGVPE